jgi:hypothetical protein
MIRTLTATALLLASGLAMAQQTAAPETPGIDPGTLTAFSEYDIDGNGIVTLAEFESLVPDSVRAAARACDTDADQRLSEREYKICAGLDPVVLEPAPR